MTITTVTSRELNHDVARAKKAAKSVLSSSQTEADPHMSC